MSNAETKLLMLRNLRNELLNESDWIVTKSLEAGVAVPDEWKTYRQELRDITKTAKPKSSYLPAKLDLESVTFPKEPS